MTWLITRFPELLVESKKAISDWIQENYEEREQARDDTYTYGPQAAFGSTSAVYLYSKALATIDRLDKQLNLLLISPTLFTFDSKNYSMAYNQYVAEVPNLKSFKKTGWGTSSSARYPLIVNGQIIRLECLLVMTQYQSLTVDTGSL